MDFKDYVKKELSAEKTKFVIVLGSGYHKHVFGDDIKSPLTSWNNLLERLGSEWNNNKISSLVEFELLIIQSAKEEPDKPANELEDRLLKRVVEIIKKEQDAALERYNDKFPLWLFNKKYVSDVISLNFDLIPELLLLKRHAKNRLSASHVYIDKKAQNKEGEKLPCTRHRIIDGITFWHPHGDIDSYNSIILGLRRYGNNIKNVERLRKNAKRNEKPKLMNPKITWVDVLFKQPILVVGAGITDAEYDVWYTIINRIRNFAKRENQKHAKPIYKMMKNNDNYEDILFQPIIAKSNDIDKQWDYLKEIFD